MAVQGMVSNAIHSVMIAGLIVAVIAFCVVLTIPSLPLQGAYAQFGKGAAKKTDDEAIPDTPALAH